MAVKFKNETVEKYQDLAVKIKDNLEASGSTIKEKEERKPYYENLPEGITEEQVKELSKYNAKYMTAAHVAVGEVAAEIMLKNNSIDQVRAEVGFFGPHDSISFTIDREKVYQNHLSSDGPKEVVKNLVITSSADIQSARGISLKAVREAMGAEFKNMLKK